MSDAPEQTQDDVAAHLSRLEHWWGLSSANPLYAWEAISVCLSADPQRPLPGWCVDYLRKTSRSMTEAAWGCCRDARNGKVKPSTEEAKNLAVRAIGLIQGQGKPNAFASLIKDAQIMRDGIGDGDSWHIQNVAMDNSIEPRQARRRIAAGKSRLSSRPKHPGRS